MMKNQPNKIPRRLFIKNAAQAGLAGTVALPGLASGKKKAKQKPKVVLIREAQVIGKNRKINAPVLQNMLNQAMLTLTGKKQVDAAWRSLFSAEDVVGIKSNAWANLATPPVLEEAIKEGLRSAGVKDQNLGVDDRGVRANPVFKKATALVNVRPLRTHHWSGVGGCIKNPIMFVPEPYKYHQDFCGILGQMWKDAGIIGKVKLNILVLLTPLFYGLGPHHYNSNHVWNYNGLLISTDPVAVDAVGLRILEAKRKDFFEEVRPFRPIAHHIKLADTRYGLGTADLKKMELIKLGWEEGRMV
jgi:uncharacterized Fe-S center protein